MRSLALVLLCAGLAFAQKTPRFGAEGTARVAAGTRPKSGPRSFDARLLERAVAERSGAAAARAVSEHVRGVVMGGDEWRARRVVADGRPVTLFTLPDAPPAPKLSTAERAHAIADYLSAAVRDGTDPAALTVRAVADATGDTKSSVARSPVWLYAGSTRTSPFVPSTW